MKRFGAGDLPLGTFRAATDKWAVRGGTCDVRSCPRTSGWVDKMKYPDAQLRYIG